MNADNSTQHEWFLSSPWDPIYVRRGDPLGLRGLNDQLGDLVAPGLTNRTVDARWISILSWCLVRSHEVWLQAGGDSVHNRETARLRYAWLRPLELMWVARTLIVAAGDTRRRQLPGQRRVRAWLRAQRIPPRFAMTHDQFRSYRQSGIYGAYRTVLRSLPALTRGHDGWTPDTNCHVLARAVDHMLHRDGAGFEPGERDRRIRASWHDKEEGWWLKSWPRFDIGSDVALPQKRTALVTLEEAQTLRTLVFGEDPHGLCRTRVASVMNCAGSADHQALCEELAVQLAPKSGPSSITMLPRFALLADAGVLAMDAIAREIAQSEDTPGIPISVLARREEVRDALGKMADAAQRWLASDRVPIRHVETGDRLAAAVSSGSTLKLLRALLQHHTSFGGAVRWFVLRDDIVEPLLVASQRASSRYRFRLWALARIAAQVGEARTIPLALRNDTDTDVEDEDEEVEAA